MWFNENFVYSISDFWNPEVGGAGSGAGSGGPLGGGLQGSVGQEATTTGTERLGEPGGDGAKTLEEDLTNDIRPQQVYSTWTV